MTEIEKQSLRFVLDGLAFPAERWQIVLYMRDLEKKYGENAAKNAGRQPAAQAQPNLGAEQYQQYQPGVMVSGRNPEQRMTCPMRVV